MTYELPEPSLIGTVDRIAVDTIVQDHPGRNYGFNRGSRQGDDRFVIDTFSHLAQDLHTIKKFPASTTVRLEKVNLWTSTAEPGQAPIHVADILHADPVYEHTSMSGKAAHLALLHTLLPTEYACGELSAEAVAEILHKPLPDNQQLSLIERIKIGKALSHYNYKELQDRYPGIYFMQPLPQVAHLLTIQNLHRSPTNITKQPVTRSQFNLIFSSQEH